MMYIHRDPLTGHVRKFKSGRAFKAWSKAQAAKYVPTLKEDIDAFSTPTLGVGHTSERIAGLTKSRKGGIKLGGPKGRHGLWSEVGQKTETMGKVTRISDDRKLILTDKKTGEKYMVRLKGGPVMDKPSNTRLGLGSDPTNDKRQAYAQVRREKEFEQRWFK